MVTESKHDRELEQGLEAAELREFGLDEDLAQELAQLEAAEAAALGIESTGAEQWTDLPKVTFRADQRATTTILVSGLTMAHDTFVQAGLAGIGYRVKALDCPDNDALRMGKEFGNRGQCNPTYFTVGNLVKYLIRLRDKEGISTEEIIAKHVFVTAGACGPCRFGTYVTEYRKALRDSGFDGFRVLLFQQTGGLKQATGADQGLQLNTAFFTALCKAIVIGDVLNLLGYRIRPYELVKGATDEALLECRERISAALRKERPLLPTLAWVRWRLGAVGVDRSRIRPRVAIIGEFWAMTTEGDGNYHLQRFLETEGAEVEVQIVTVWLLYLAWEGRWDTLRRAELRGADQARRGLAGVDVRKRLLMIGLADRAIRAVFGATARLMGLADYHLPDMDKIAETAHQHYDNLLRGGEGHMEVGKLILNVVENKVNMTISVKPFGCMPSSSVSDGVQSLITEMYPQAIFLPIETSGDGAVNVQSRVQMQLFKARKAAALELERALAAEGLSQSAFEQRARTDPRYAHALHRSPHRAGCTAADLAHEMGAEGAASVVVGALRALRGRAFAWCGL